MRKSFLAALLCTACAAKPAAPPETYTWTELGPNARAIQRSIETKPCPGATHATPNEAFPVSVCDREAPAVKAPRRILFLGDTGCRLKKENGKLILQACNDPEKWPFAQLAQAAAAWKPDLVVHVGDYHYRETDCPPGEKSCAGSVTGDRWKSWRQDFFDPARPLLAAAPWIFLRGNHEQCDRAGHGWFHLLDPRPVPAACTDATPAYEIPLGDHRFVVLDSAAESNIAASLATLAPAKEFTWLLLHRPYLKLGKQLPPILAKPGDVAAVFTGHHHILSLNRFDDARPPELITGNGGDLLDPSDNLKSAVKEFHDFGFMTLERENGGWLAQEHDRTGKVVFACRLREATGRKTELRCD